MKRGEEMSMPTLASPRLYPGQPRGARWWAMPGHRVACIYTPLFSKVAAAQWLTDLQLSPHHYGVISLERISNTPHNNRAGYRLWIVKRGSR